MAGSAAMPEDEDEMLDQPEAQAPPAPGQDPSPGPDPQSDEDLDQLETSQAAPTESPDTPVTDPVLDSQPPGQNASQMPDPSQYMISPAELQATRDAQRKTAMIGMIGQALANQQSLGNFLTGKMNPKNDVMGMADQMIQQEGQPLADKQALMKQAMQAPAMQYLRDQMDPNSDVTQQARNMLNMAVQAGRGLPTFQKNPAILDAVSQGGQNMNAYQIKNLLDANPYLKDLIPSSVKEDQANMMVNRMMAMMGNRNNTQAQQSLNKDPLLSQYIPRIDGAAKILDLISAGEQGQFKTNKALLGQLNAEIGRLETGSNSPGLSASEKTEMNDAAASLKDLYDTVTGGVTGVDLSQKFAQARGMINDLGNSYANQINNRLAYLQAGALPDQQSVFNSKANQIRYAYGNKFPGGFQSNDQGAQAQPAPAQGQSANAGGPQTRVINGQTYIKVDGGWKKAQ